MAKASLNQGLKMSIFVVQKATAPKSGVEFRQGSIGTIRGSLAMSYDVWRRREVFSLPTHSPTHKAVYGGRHAA